MATLHTQFGQNVLADEDGWRLVLDDGDLAGLPDFAREAAAAAAKEHGLDGKYAITLSRSSVEPFLCFSARRDLRETAYRAWVQRGEHPGEHDNAPLIAELLALRQEQARLLGYDTYAAYRLDDTMAKTPGAAEHLLEQVWEPAKHKAAAERAELVAGRLHEISGPRLNFHVFASLNWFAMPIMPTDAPRLMFGYSSAVATPMRAVAPASWRSAWRTSGRRRSRAAPSPTGIVAATRGGLEH